SIRTSSSRARSTWSGRRTPARCRHFPSSIAWPGSASPTPPRRLSRHRRTSCAGSRPCQTDPMGTAMTWDDGEAFLLRFPDTETSTSWGMPGVKTGGTLVAWWRDRDDSPASLAFKVDRAELEALVEDPDTPYYAIEHFRKFDSNAVLVRLADADPEEL